MTLYYHITVKEYLDDSWSTWFDGLAITHAADGATTLEGSIRDQSALYGLIDKARDLVSPVLGREPSTRLIETVFDLENLTDIRTLRRLLQRG